MPCQRQNGVFGAPAEIKPLKPYVAFRPFAGSRHVGFESRTFTEAVRTENR
jgi:hypothetical protein